MVLGTVSWSPARDRIPLSQVRYSYEQDTTQKHTGQASALVQHGGVPLGTPLANGWVQEGFFQLLLDGALKEAKSEDAAKVASEIARVKRDYAICPSQAG